MIDRTIRACLTHPGAVALAFVALLLAGLFAITKISVDAIPDIGEKQVIVYADWQGRSPQNVEDQVTYPLSSGMTGTPGVKSIRAMSGFGFSMVFLVFQDDVDFHWARSRVLERLTVAQQNLPQGVQPRLGPDATALGQVYMYTLEGEGLDLGELRTIQDWYVKYQLQSVEGVSEVASIGGYVQQYQIELDPARMRAANVTVPQVEEAVRASNSDAGAKAVEQNGMEYFVRGVGFVRSAADLENTTIREYEGTPVRVRDVADVRRGPDFRRGALDDGGVETVGGIVTMRFGENPRAVVDRVKERIQQIETGLASAGGPGGRAAKVTIRPFYDRTQVIDETIATLKEAVTEEIIVTAFVVFVFLLHLRASAAILTTMPLALATAFVGMWALGIDANIMSIAGIAIAIGDVTDMGIIMAENIFRNLAKAPPGASRFEVVYRGATEVGEAIWGAVSNTLVSFLPVFALTEEEGKLFHPLAYTKSFAIVASFLLAITVVPVACLYLLHEVKIARWKAASFAAAAGIAALALARIFLPIDSARGSGAGWPISIGLGLMIAAAVYWTLRERLRAPDENPVSRATFAIYAPTLRWVLRHKSLFLVFPASIVLLGITIWLGFDRIFGAPMAALESIGIDARNSRPAVALRHAFPGIGREFMPPLDEGSFLYMPSLLPSASLTEALDVIATQDSAIAQLPEVERVVGKLGRAESALDPAPIAMIETIIMLKPESQWRTVATERFWEALPEWLHSPIDRWFPKYRRITKSEILAELQAVTEIPGVLPSWLQPIETRILMLQSGFRAVMGVKVYGKSIEDIENAAVQMETILRRVPGAADVVADRIVGKPYLEFRIDREALGRYGLRIDDVQRVLETAVGGENLTMTVEGRERYPVRIRYPRGDRENVASLERVLIASASGAQIPISSVAKIVVSVGPSEIKSENGSLVGYVTLNARGRDEVAVVEDARDALLAAHAGGSLRVAPGVHWEWAGKFESQARSTRRLSILVPLCLLLDVILLYASFRKWWIALLCFSAIPISACGGFLMLYLWGVNLSVAVWVGFIALFGVAEDDSVVMATYLRQLFRERAPRTVEAIRETVVEAGLRRIRPCLMTTATTVFGLMPVFTATGRGSDVMQPMAIPSLGGMAIQLITLFVTPCVYCAIEEWKLSRRPPETQV